MPLKRSKIEETEPKKAGKKKGNAAVRVSGDVCQRFGKAHAAEKVAGVAKNIAATALKNVAAPAYYTAACTMAAAGMEPPASLKFADDTGSVVGFQFKSTYATTTADVAELLCSKLSRLTGEAVDVNDHFHEVPGARFDTSVFVLSNGDFNEATFKKIQKAIARVTGPLGIANPLSVTNVVTVRKDFHVNRFVKFPESAQTLISDLIPNTVAVTVGVVTDKIID